MTAGIFAVLAAVAFWILVSGRVARWSVTAPIVLTIAGLALGSASGSPIRVDLETEQVRELVEIALALILFNDASSIKAGWFGKRRSRLAARLLFIGLPLTIGLGYLVALPLLDASNWAVLAVIAAALAPTDAALGAAVAEDSRIPLRIREVINVESGLNDGLATPFVLFFLAIATAEGAHDSASHAAGAALTEIGVAIVVGALVGLLGGRLVVLATRGAWSTPLLLPILPFAFALMAYFGSIACGGNGFVAAFAAGVAFGTAAKVSEQSDILRFNVQTGMLLSLFVWFLFGAAFVRPGFDDATWQIVLYAILSLTIIRMIPVALALVRGAVTRDEVWLIGWLGPRGLASIVFALIVVDDIALAGDNAVAASVITVTVTFSVLAHGLTAAPAGGLFARRVARHKAELDSSRADDATPTRGDDSGSTSIGGTGSASPDSTELYERTNDE